MDHIYRWRIVILGFLLSGTNIFRKFYILPMKHFPFSQNGTKTKDDDKEWDMAPKRNKKHPVSKTTSSPLPLSIKMYWIVKFQFEMSSEIGSLSVHMQSVQHSFIFLRSSQSLNEPFQRQNHLNNFTFVFCLFTSAPEKRIFFMRWIFLYILFFHVQPLVKIILIKVNNKLA